MPPPVLLGAGLVGSAATGLFGASEAGNAAKNARRSAQQSFDFAQQFRPELFGPNAQQQSDFYRLLLQQQFQPTFFTPQQQAQAASSLTDQFNKQTEQGRQTLNESNASRGLFRSGIGAQQESQYLGNQNKTLQDLLLQQDLQFRQQNAAEAARAFGLNQQALGMAGNYGLNQLNQQQDLYRLLLGYAQGQGAGAGQATTAANQAFGQAIQGPFNALTQGGLLGMMGGFPGMGGGAGAMPPGGYPIPNQSFQFQPGMF